MLGKFITVLDMLDEETKSDLLHRIVDNHPKMAEMSETLREEKQKRKMAEKSLKSLSRQMHHFRQDYSYDRHSVVELSQVIARNLVDKPPEIDRNRIYNCVKLCRDDYERGWQDNPDYLFIDVRMLLATCLASNWFTDTQGKNMRNWIGELI